MMVLATKNEGESRAKHHDSKGHCQARQTATLFTRADPLRSWSTLELPSFGTSDTVFEPSGRLQ